MLRYADPPVLLTGVLHDVEEAVRVLAQEAPYPPLGGWYSPGADPRAKTRPMWFRNDWVHADYKAPGAELFLDHPAYIQAAKDFYDAEVVEPQSIYVNLMVAINAGGPAHTDNPRFHGRERTNTPMWLLRLMLWSGLFDDFEIVQATAIWWLNDVEGGGLYYWPKGPGEPPEHHVGNMANTALLGDNHGMFHQVAPIGPATDETLRVTPMAQLAPSEDDPSVWVVTDHDEEVFRAPLRDYRMSVLWKADVYPTAGERDRRRANPLSMADVERVFNRDLERQKTSTRFDLGRLDDPAMRAALEAVYPEDRPIQALPSVFDR